MSKVKKGETPIESWNGIFADPEVGRVLYTNGLIANATYSTEGELSKITALYYNKGPEQISYFYDNKVITQFPELKYCTGLTRLDFIFRNCSNLTTVGDIPEGVTNLSNTFAYCSSLTSAPIIPESIAYMAYAFNGCSSIDGIYIINAVTPPFCNNSLSNVQAIYVPDASVDAYKTASGWIEFADKIFPMSDKPQ